MHVFISKTPTYLVERFYLDERRLSFFPWILSNPVKLLIKDVVELLKFLSSFNEFHNSLNDNSFVVNRDKVNRSNMRIIILGCRYSAYFMVLEEPFLSFGKLYCCWRKTAPSNLPSH